jgi:hypothetical protein
MRCASSSLAAALYRLLLLQNKCEAFAAAVITFTQSFQPCQMLFVFEPCNAAGSAAQRRQKNKKSNGTSESDINGQRIYLGVHLGMTGRL